jgi:uncharacterized membrane protein
MIAFMGGAAGNVGDWASRVMTAPTRGLSSRCLTEAVNDPAAAAPMLHEISNAHAAACIQRIQDVFAMRDMSLHENGQARLGIRSQAGGICLNEVLGLTRP